MSTVAINAATGVALQHGIIASALSPKDSLSFIENMAVSVIQTDTFKLNFITIAVSAVSTITQFIANNMIYEKLNTESKKKYSLPYKLFQLSTYIPNIITQATFGLHSLTESRFFTWLQNCLHTGNPNNCFNTTGSPSHPTFTDSFSTPISPHDARYQLIYNHCFSLAIGGVIGAETFSNMHHAIYKTLLKIHTPTKKQQILLSKLILIFLKVTGGVSGAMLASYLTPFLN
ncbi:MAG: hypothetical protein HAW62_01780 [Endozoicomonadaceae bacterium]|nr:hypothetical protein [Endozoicomonadaceae bacterium]